MTPEAEALTLTVSVLETHSSQLGSLAAKLDMAIGSLERIEKMLGSVLKADAQREQDYQAARRSDSEERAKFRKDIDALKRLIIKPV